MVLNTHSTDAQPLLVYITTQDAQEAKAIATALVTGKLAACANIVPAIESIFFWDNAVQCSTESLLVLKSTQDRFTALCEKARALHSYTNPCIVALPIVAGIPDFLQWIHDNTRDHPQLTPSGPICPA